MSDRFFTSPTAWPSDGAEEVKKEEKKGWKGMRGNKKEYVKKKEKEK